MSHGSGLRSFLLPILVVAFLLMTTGPAQADVTFRVHPRSGPVGTRVHLRGAGLPIHVSQCSFITWWIGFQDASGASGIWPIVPDETGSFRSNLAVPDWAQQGAGTFTVGITYRTGSLCRGEVLARHR